MNCAHENKYKKQKWDRREQEQIAASKGSGTHPLQDLTEDMMNMGPKGVLILQVHSTQLSHLSTTSQK
jgi:hypothetical protein